MWQSDSELSALGSLAQRQRSLRRADQYPRPEHRAETLALCGGRVSIPFRLVGDYRALRYRPTRVQDGRLSIRCGLRWEVDLTREQVHAVIAPTRAIENRDDCLALTSSTKPDLILALTKPETIDGPYGITRQAQYLGVSVDDPTGFRQAIL